MSSTDGPYSVEILPGAQAFSAADWARLDAADRSSASYNPFISHAFLSALELSGSVGKGTGWQPRFLKVMDEDRYLVAAVPSYAKSHSQGEYVFDHGWADAYMRAGGQYYPKLQVAVPFTPATGPRLLSVDGKLAGKMAAAAAIIEATNELKLSSAHVTFAPESEAEIMEAQGYLRRTDQQFHFLNTGYRDYQDFLSTLASRKRKALRKEREAAYGNGITVERLTGNDLTEPVWDQFFKFYMDTGSRKWGQPYLTRNFFSLIGQTMSGDILLVMAKRNGRYIAGAINFIGAGRIYGRNWGCIEDHPFLHFEVCYHQAIDHAIAHGLKVVEAGAQGEHKLARGYVPVTTHSAHYIRHEGLRRAIADYLVHERKEVARAAEYLSEHAPFRKGPELTGAREAEE
jgi:uncharacterized protein